MFLLPLKIIIDKGKKIDKSIQISTSTNNNINKPNFLKKRFNNIKQGIIKVYNTPTLPDHILNFNKNIFVRIFRIIGGLCLLLTLSQKLFNFNETFIYLAIFIDFIFLIYQFGLIIYRIKNIYKILKTDSLDIRNNPLDKIASILTRGLFCLKGACEGGIYFGTEEQV
jgi:hypothetical protein